MIKVHPFGNLILGQSFVGEECRLPADFDAFVFIVIGVNIPCPGLVLCHAEIAEVVIPHGGGIFNGFYLAFGIVHLGFFTVFINAATAPLAEIFICPFVFDGNVGIPAGKRFYDGLGFRPCGLKPDTIIRHGRRFISVIPVCIPFGTPICKAPAVPGGFAVQPQIIPRLLAECKVLASDVCPHFEKALLACNRNIRQMLRIDRPAERIHIDEVPVCVKPRLCAAACFQVKTRRHRNDFIEIHRVNTVFVVLDVLKHLADFCFVALKREDIDHMIRHRPPPSVPRADAVPFAIVAALLAGSIADGIVHFFFRHLVIILDQNVDSAVLEVGQHTSVLIDVILFDDLLRQKHFDIQFPFHTIFLSFSIFSLMESSSNSVSCLAFHPSS